MKIDTTLITSDFYSHDEKILDAIYTLSDKDFAEGYAILKKGKKVFIKIKFK